VSRGKDKALFSNFSLLTRKGDQSMNVLDFVESLIEKGYSESDAWMLWFENHNNHEAAADEVDNDLYN
jgi:hypothetical protein